MKISQITLNQNNDGLYTVIIKHDARAVKSGKYKNAADAYADAESRLIYKPGYVQVVPKGER